MKGSRLPREAVILPESTQKNLGIYALVASAAGVSMLALAKPAEAKIIYTPAHKNIGTMTFLDLNHDGVSDFKFTLVRTSRCVGRCTTTGVHPATAFASTNATLRVYGVRTQNQMYGPAKSVSALMAGVPVGPKGKFPGGDLMALGHAISGNNTFYAGPWAGPVGGGGVQHRYLGLRFTISGKIHYGWARLNVVMSKDAHIQAELTGYAYETISNKPIITGRTKGPDVVTVPVDTGAGTLRHLALGRR